MVLWFTPMKILLARNRNKPVDRAVATKCLILNLFATPGLGSWIANRTGPAIGQLILAFVGFCVIIAWFVQLEWQMYNAIMSDNHGDASYTRLGKIGAVIFIGAWLWSFQTSLSVRAEARRNESAKKPPEPPEPPRQPPIISSPR